MQLIVGLGNPGDRYRHTRHNVGYIVVDHLAARLGVEFVPGRGEFWFADAAVGEKRVLLLKPTTFMNSSGFAVLEAAQRYDVGADRMMVVYDDFQLPLGAVRMRPSGSDGGHHGLESVIFQLQTDQVPRLRCGICPETKPAGRDAIIDFVLSEFDEHEKPAANDMIERAGNAVLEYVALGIESAMNRYNTTAP